MNIFYNMRRSSLTSFRAVDEIVLIQICTPFLNSYWIKRNHTENSLRQNIYVACLLTSFRGSRKEKGILNVLYPFSIFFKKNWF
jgi:hypothetical protein